MRAMILFHVFINPTSRGFFLSSARYSMSWRSEILQDTNTNYVPPRLVVKEFTWDQFFPLVSDIDDAGEN